MPTVSHVASVNLYCLRCHLAEDRRVWRFARKQSTDANPGQSLLPPGSKWPSSLPHERCTVADPPCLGCFPAPDHHSRPIAWTRHGPLYSAVKLVTTFRVSRGRLGETDVSPAQSASAVTSRYVKPNTSQTVLTLSGVDPESNTSTESVYAKQCGVKHAAIESFAYTATTVSLFHPIAVIASTSPGFASG